jgi:hypothetical protein
VRLGRGRAIAQARAQRLFQPDHRGQRELAAARQRLFQRGQADPRHVRQRLARDAPPRQFLAQPRGDSVSFGGTHFIGFGHGMSFASNCGHLRTYPHSPSSDPATIRTGADRPDETGGDCPWLCGAAAA